jgi:hypothetical protein
LHSAFLKYGNNSNCTGKIEELPTLLERPAQLTPKIHIYIHNLIFLVLFIVCGEELTKEEPGGAFVELKASAMGSKLVGFWTLNHKQKPSSRT